MSDDTTAGPSDRLAEQPLAFYDGEATCCLASSHQFAETTIAAILSALPSWTNWRMHVGGGTPPYSDPGRVPAGHMEITLSAPGVTERCIGMVFGAREDAGRLVRQPFEAEDWLSDPLNPWATGLAAFNFDEAWRCSVSESVTD